MFTYILTKFGANWLFFVDAKNVNKVKLNNVSLFMGK